MRTGNFDRNHAARATAYRKAAAAQLMEFFYPVHYEIGTALEDAVRADILSRQQAASLWLIRSQGEGGSRMRRKDIEANLRRWFEVTSAAVSRALRAMMRPPLELIAITEDPNSGREKLVSLTPKGEAFLDSVAVRATQVLADLIDEVPLEVIDAAIIYFRHLTSTFALTQTRTRIRLIRPSQKSPGEPANPKSRGSGK